jgi:hypothetical protein
VFIKNLKTAVRALALAVILTLGAVHLSKAGDNIEMAPADFKKAEAGLRSWLSLLDQGKYAETFAAAAELFRQNSSVENWKDRHAIMLEDSGPVVSRGEIVSFVPSEKPNPDRMPAFYFVTFKTKFKKKSGTEYVQIMKDNGDWKVASYSSQTEK